ncbi:phosphatidate cytidylyltransferase [Desulfurivibrio dismutans]|uniref:phosphatidate cytidylyltransferase n=1 Tax=Desulfurivibrio dismutans TaxID=1398908 RepID=UPI0023DC2B07|nr:phosphatidate cytidylyltransferase [Desulfurivibrio alkaliphilus]MDF1614867.1 phosphatidate cytidylyltransferase [Desulfurivibrio alkaliphilus]
MQRILTGICTGVAWLLLLLYAPFWLFWLTVGLLTLLILHEYGNMLLVKGGEPPLRPALLAFGLLPVLAAGQASHTLMVGALVIALTGLLLLTVFRYGSLERPLFFLFSAAFGIFYLGLLMAHLPLLINLENGRHWLIIVSLITVSADSGAYYVGTHLGRHKLCPALSPGKTVEGLLGGVATALLVVGLAVMVFFPAINLLQALLFTFILSLLSVAGDLAESLLKRGAGVKDSGTLLPGHGGILDRIDSLLLAAPLLYYLLLTGDMF